MVVARDISGDVGKILSSDFMLPSGDTAPCSGETGVDSSLLLLKTLPIHLVGDRERCRAICSSVSEPTMLGGFDVKSELHWRERMDGD